MYEAAPAEAKAYFIWGDELPGFGVRIFASGEREHLAVFKRPRSIDFVETIPHSEAGKVSAPRMSTG